MFSCLQSILPAQPAEHKEQPDPPTVRSDTQTCPKQHIHHVAQSEYLSVCVCPHSGPRCVALFDYEGEEDDELTFSQGDVIALLELIGPEWGRGQIHGRIGIFPLNFTEVAEPLPAQAPEPEPADTPLIESTSELPFKATSLFSYCAVFSSLLCFVRSSIEDLTGLAGECV